ncbi:MAG: fibrobacter succinogenes major paralogous domain-containing protein [Bacteroidales bacterium]|nr:fibrobacter succinogenes major paralogous domain-containing protein [Bacteroidales bacterium]
MKKYCFLFLLFSTCLSVFAQTGSVEMPLLVSGYANNGGISASVGQVFDALAPDGASVPIITEGIQQGGQSACGDITEVEDVDHNIYPAVDLGLYCWTAQNLRTEHYADNTDVPNIMTYSAVGYSSSDLFDVFGHLYTWDAATQYNSGQGICPDGWHIPTDAEMEYVIATYTPEELMANTQWLPIPGTDISQFTLLPGGRYNSTYGLFENLLVNAYVWTIREESTLAIACKFGTECSTSEFIPSEKANGHSVRCVLNY